MQHETLAEIQSNYISQEVLLEVWVCYLLVRVEYKIPLVVSLKFTMTIKITYGINSKK